MDLLCILCGVVLFVACCFGALVLGWLIVLLYLFVLMNLSGLLKIASFGVAIVMLFDCGLALVMLLLWYC